ncbi:MAG: DNA polymerase I, partial [Tannerella sp.]|nr:DNA polymerase I [Tannerella sp.]
MRLLLIDAYALIYRSYYAFIQNPRINSKGMNTSAVFGFVNSMEDVLKRLEPTHVAVGFDPAGPTFRHEAFEAYKAQREETPEDIRLAVPYIREIITAFRIPILEVARYEADDVIGTVAKQAGAEGFEVFMMTPDKDYGQLVSDRIFQYRPRHGGDYETLGVPEVLAKYGLKHVGQMTDLLGLMGDSSDNIPGCPGVGEKTAGKLLAEYGSVENLLAHAGELKGALRTKIEGYAEQIRFSKYLATIVTDAPVRFDAALCVRRERDRGALTDVYAQLEFRAFINRMNAEEAPRQASQLSLFGDDDVEVRSAAEAGAAETDGLADAGSTAHKYVLVDTAEAREALGKLLAACGEFAFDTETDGLNPLEANLVGMSFAVREHEAWYVPVPEPGEEAARVVAPFVEALENPHSTKIGQNIKFDMLVMRNCGVRLGGRLFDTMIAHYLLNPELRHGMDYLAETYLHYRPVPIEALIGARGKKQLSMREVAAARVCEYAAEDADVTLRLKNVFAPRLAAEGLESLFGDVEMPLVGVLAAMESAGVTIDREALRQSSEELTKVAIALEAEIHTLAGREFNVNSARQAGEVLFDHLKIEEKAKKTKTGHYSTNEEVLEKLRNRHPVVGRLLEYRGVKKLLSTYVDALPELISARTGKIHTSFNQTVTSTGRLSSTGPNLQNIPIRDSVGREIRRAFIPDGAECVFLSADYSQIELRVMAHLSGDENMIGAFRHGADIHAATAAKIYGVSPDAVPPDMRRKAKTANFGIIYGISVFGLAERLSIGRGEARELIEGYFATYPQVREYMEQSIRTARAQGYVETILHRKRYLPDIHSGNAVVRGYAERNAINAPVQGSAADIIKVAMVRIHRRFEAEGLRSRMILQVHDELNFNVRRDELERVRRIV